MNKWAKSIDTDTLNWILDLSMKEILSFSSIPPMIQLKCEPKLSTVRWVFLYSHVIESNTIIFVFSVCIWIMEFKNTSSNNYTNKCIFLATFGDSMNLIAILFKFRLGNLTKFGGNRFDFQIFGSATFCKCFDHDTTKCNRQIKFILGNLSTHVHFTTTVLI